MPVRDPSSTALAFPDFRWSRGRVALAAALVAAAGVLFYFRNEVDLQAVYDRVGEFNGWLMFASLTALPLFGFPVSPLHVLTGARFGLPIGMALVAIALAIQLTASYALVGLAPVFFARRLKRFRKRLPPATHRSLTLFTILFPGAPFFAQNYMLAIAGVPFRTFFAISWPIHFCRSLIGVALGGWLVNMTPGRVAFFVVYSLAVILGCVLAFRRLRVRLKNPQPVENGRKQLG